MLPKIMGCDFSGTIVEVPQHKEKADESCDRLEVGDKVIGESK